MEEYELVPYAPLSNPVEEEEEKQVQEDEYELVEPAEITLAPTTEVKRGDRKDRRDVDASDELDLSQIEGRGESTRDDILANEDDMFYIKQYMADRKGVSYAGVNDKKTLDDFIKHMRYVNVNEVNTIGESRYINDADEQTKEIAGRAYLTFEKLAPMWSNGSVKDALFGAVDYATGTVVAPSSLLGGIFGKAVGKGVAKTASKAVTAAALKAAKQAAAKGGSKEAQRMAATAVLKNAAIKTGAVEVGASTAADAAMAMGQDNVLQHLEIEAGARGEYNTTQTALSGLFGVVGGALSTVPLVMQANAPYLSNVKIREAHRAKLDANKALLNDKFKSFADKVKEKIPNIKERLGIENGAHEAANEIARMMLDVEDETSVFNMMKSVGVGIKASKGNQAFINMVDFIQTIDEDVFNEMDDVFTEAFGMHFGEALDVVGASLSSGADLMGQIGRASQLLEETGARSKLGDASARQLETLQKEAEEEALAKGGPRQWLKYTQSLWRRSLVSHISTSALNVQGWVQGTGIRSLSDMGEGVLHGITGMGYVIPSMFNKEARNIMNKEFRTSASLFANQLYKANRLIDPYSTKQNFEKLLESSAYAKKQLGRSFFAGIDQSPAAVYNVDNTALGKLGEGYSSLSTKLTLVRLQDSFTKAVSAAAEMDKQIRLNEGLAQKGIRNLDDLYRTGMVEEIDDDMWDKVVEASLKDTFSADYTKGGGAFAEIAGTVEKLSGLPVVGFFFPFGRFMNNIMAHVATYSPLNIVGLSTKALRRQFDKNIPEITRDELFQRASQTMVGTSLLASLAYVDEMKQNDDQRWNEVVNQAGDTVDIGYVAPNSIYRNAARILNRWREGEAVDTELAREFIDQLGAAGLLTEVGRADKSLTSIFDTISDMVAVSDPEEIAMTAKAVEESRSVLTGKFVGMVGALVGDIASGLTRPLDVPNTVVGALTGDDESLDRRMVDHDPVARLKADLFRYTDHLFEVATGNKVAPVKQSATLDEPLKDPNPVGTMFGKREVKAKDPINILLSKVDMAEWRQDSRTSVPELDNAINTYVTPYLNQGAKTILEDTTFQKADFNMKRAIVKAFVTDAKAYIRDAVEDGVYGEKGVVDGLRRRINSKSKDLRRVASRELGIDATRLHSLSYEDLVQLDVFIGFMEDRTDIYKLYNE